MTLIAEEGRVRPNWSKTFQTFRSHSSIFALEKRPKNLNFQRFLPLIDPLVATFSETREPAYAKYLAKQGIVMSNWSKSFQTFRSHSFAFAIEKQPKILNF